MIRAIIDIASINAQQWDALAQSVRTASWFQTREAVAFYAQLPEELRAVVCAVEEDGVLLGVAVACVAWNGGRLGSHFTRRAVIDGGPMLSDDISAEALEQLLLALREQLRRQAIYIEMRCFEDYSRWRSVFERCGFSYEPHFDFHVDTSSSDAIFARMSKSRKRNIKAALDLGARVVDQPTQEQVREFYAILHNLYRRKVRTPLWSLSFFERLSEQPNARFVLIEFDGHIVSGTACVCLPGRTVYEWYVCGDDEHFGQVYPSSYATYQGILYAADNGFTRFDMMGASAPDEESGVRDFKARFGGRLVEYGRFRCVCNPIRYKLGSLGVKLLKRL